MKIGHLATSCDDIFLTSQYKDLRSDKWWQKYATIQVFLNSCTVIQLIDNLYFYKYSQNFQFIYMTQARVCLWSISGSVDFLARVHNDHHPDIWALGSSQTLVQFPMFYVQKLIFLQMSQWKNHVKSTRLNSFRSYLRWWSIWAFSILFSLARRFWNQILIWFSVRHSISANS